MFIQVKHNQVKAAIYLADIYTQERYSAIMKKHIETSKMGDILKEEFMKPFKLSAYTSLRLAKYFGVSDSYFLNIQNDIDIRNAKYELEAEIAKIQTVVVA